MAGNYKIKIEPILNTASLNKQFNETKQLKLSGAGQSAGNSFMSGFGRAVKERAKYSIANFLIYGTQNAIKDMVANVRELDAAQTELKKVTDLSGKSLAKFTDEAYEVGSKVAKTGTEIVQASTEFAKMGKDTKTALQLSELASRFQNIADTEIDAATAAKFINSQLKAFGNTSTLQKFTGDFAKAERIIDVTNDTANKFAVGTNDLQNALTKTGSALSVAGNTFEQTIGLVTAGTEIMVGQPAKVGRGLRSIAINIANLARENEYFEAANGKVKIALQDSNGEMLSTYDIMAKLAEKWGTLNETEQTAIATSLAGKTQFEVFANVMKNWATAANVVDNAAKANGSSLRENEKYLDSIEGKLQAFQSAWEQLSYHVMNSDFLKGVIDLGTDLIKVLDNLVQKIGTLPTLIGLISTAFGGLKLFKFAEGLLTIGTAAEKAAEGVEAVAEASTVASGAKGLSGLKNIIGFLSNPAVIGGIVALGAAIGAIAWDKYFSLGSSVERLNEYQDKLKEVSSEIEQLQEKRGTDEGLTRAEALHLDVLLAEERSLERQVELEKQRVQNAFKKDISNTGGKNYKGRTGPAELVAYQNARTAELDIYKQMEEKQRMIDDARLKLGYAYEQHNEKDIERYKNVLEVFDKELAKLDSQRAKFSSEVADTSAELLSYWEQVVSSVDYSKLTSEEQDAFNDLHKNVVTSQLDIENLESDYNDFATIINSTIDSLGYDSIDIFSGVDFSKITTLDDLITTIKENLKSLDGDKEITFSVRDKDGNIEEITKKVSELDDKDIQSIISFNAEGVDEVESEKAEASKDTSATIHVLEEGSQVAESTIEGVARQAYKATINVNEKGAPQAKKDIDDASKNRTTVISVITSGITAAKNALAGIKKAKGKRKGEAGGLAWLGDEGSSTNPKPELVVSADGRAYLAGTSGWEMHPVKDSDIVYSYSETKKLLGGKQSFLSSVEGLPTYKKGKKSSKKQTKEQKRKTTQKKASKKKKEKWEKEFNKKLDTLKHKAKVNHWSDAKYQAEYKKLYDKYYTKATQDQLWDYEESEADYLNEQAKKSYEDAIKNATPESLGGLIQSINANPNLSDDDRAEMIADATEAANKVGHDRAEKEFDRRMGLISATGTGGLTGLVKDIQANQYLSAEEKKDAIAEAYKTAVEYNLKEYKNGKATRDEILQNIEDYYKTRGEYDETYYKMLNELREADKEKELKRLQDLQEAQDNKLTLAQKYIQKELDATKKQIEADKEEADQLERLTELEKDLAQAKSKKIRVYREGVGFVYERDTEAIEKATKALDDYQRSLEKSPLEQRAEELQELLDLFDELGNDSNIKELELLLGVGNISDLTGGLTTGSDVSSWINWIKNIYALSTGYADLIKKFGDSADIDAWLTANGGLNVSDSVIAEYIKNHSFASGTLSATGGLSLIGENGAEIAWLNKGDSVYSNAISRNLMEWGRYTPAQVINKAKNSSAQIFNFDKIVLPNVHNADDFYRELQNLPNKALQQSTRRR